MKEASFGEKIGCMVLNTLGLILPLDAWWRCPIGSLLSPLEIREEVRTGVVSIQVVFKTQTALVHLKTQYVSRKESLRTESSATLTFRVGTGERTNIRERRILLNQENMSSGSQGKKCFEGRSGQQCQLADR